MPERSLKVIEHLPTNGSSVNTYDVLIDGQKISGITTVEITADARKRPFKEVCITFVAANIEWTTTDP